MIDIQKLALRLEGLQTINTICKILNVKTSSAYEYISLLKKWGYSKEIRRTSTNKRIYAIRRTPIIRSKFIPEEYSEIPRIKQGLFEIINENSPIKLVPSFEYKVQREERLTIEEALVEAIKTKKFRVILSSLALFNKIENWKRLYYFAKINNLKNVIGALYDLTRLFIRVKRMDSRLRIFLLKDIKIHRSIIPGIKSPDFEDIQKLWNVDIPFRKDDMLKLKWNT